MRHTGKAAKAVERFIEALVWVDRLQAPEGSGADCRLAQMINIPLSESKGI